MNSNRTSQAWLKGNEDFSMSPTHSWFLGVMGMTPNWESVDYEFKYRNFIFEKKT